MSVPEVRVVVSTEWKGWGKSATAHAIGFFLKRHGFNVEMADGAEPMLMIPRPDGRKIIISEQE